MRSFSVDLFFETLTVNSPANSAYRPSQELLAALADLPVELINPSRANVVHNSPAYTAVKKEEPVEHVLFPVPIKEEQNDSHGEILFSVGL